MASVRAAGEGTPAWRHALAIDEALLTWGDLASGLVVNRPAAGVFSASRTLQFAAIGRAGFAVPETLVTTDAKAAREFVAAHGDVVYKSVSGVSTIVTRVREADLRRLDQIAVCPTQFQAFVPGSDVRVHVVGDAVFACEISSSEDDYRYAAQQGKPVVLRPIVLDPDWGSRCRALTADLGLTLSGIDLRRRPDGEWCCFEVNPRPAFTCFAPEHSAPIADALVDLLASRS
jgi:glutathione synthase/RimK-type ligase-like ATP-grasp enzyme